MSDREGWQEGKTRRSLAGMLARVRAQTGLVQGSQGAPAEASLHMVPRVERFQFSIIFNSFLRRRRRHTFVGTRVEEGDITKTDAKSEDQFVSKYQKCRQPGGKHMGGDRSKTIGRVAVIQCLLPRVEATTPADKNCRN